LAGGGDDGNTILDPTFHKFAIIKRR
jgi:hypothetical protein